MREWQVVEFLNGLKWLCLFLNGLGRQCGLAVLEPTLEAFACFGWKMLLDLAFEALPADETGGAVVVDRVALVTSAKTSEARGDLNHRGRSGLGGSGASVGKY